MESKTCCAYNATRGCRINSTVTVADSAREPLKVLKVLVEGLARDSKSSLWLTPLTYAPQLTRIFPFDLAYLDEDMKVLEAVALQPETPAPRFHGGVSSALILPFNSLGGSGTVAGDQIIVCTEDELELRLAEITRPVVEEPIEPMAVEPAAAIADAPVAASRFPFAALPKIPQHPFPGPQVSVPTVAAAIQKGTAFTVGATMSSWQISKSTTAAAVLEPGEIREADADEAIEEGAESEKLGEIEVAEPESTEAQEKTATRDSVGIVVSDAAREEVSDSVSDQAAVAEAAESAIEKEPLAEGELKALEATPETVEERPGVSQVLSEAVPAAERAAVEAEPHAGAAETGTEALPAKRKRPARNAPARVAQPTNAEPIAAKNKPPEEKKKETLGVLVKRFLNCEDPLPERRTIIRLLVQGLIAYTEDREERKQYEVRDVSPTGLYLRTREHWQPGDHLSLVLQRKDATEEQCERRVHVDLKAVRRDEEGVGFEWVWPEGVEFEAWKRVHTKRSDETDADYFLRELRLTRAIGFLRQICPAAMEEMKHGLHKRLSNKRVASAVEITLKAQELLGRLEPRAKVQAHPDMVRRILENGSWTEDNWIRLWWGGLLVSSCSTGTPDTSNSVFIDLLAKLMPAHLRVLDFVCSKANERIEAGESAATLDLYCTSEELIEAVGSHSIGRIQQTMGQLASLALMAESNKPSYVSATDKVKTRATPTALALTMHARCNGRQ